MSWKKILFLCLSFVFVFGGVFGFEKEVRAGTATDIGIGATMGLPGLFYVGAKYLVGADVVNGATQYVAGQIFDAILYSVAFILHNVLFRLAALTAGISGLLFDAIIQYTVINMGSHIDTSSSGFIGIGWKVLRDVVNIMFIFVLLYVGIMTIVKGFESGTSKMIATIITVALLINFSLFFTKIIIDSSNIVAVNFYNSMEKATKSGEKTWGGISAVFIDKSGLGTLYGTPKKEDTAQGNVNLIIRAIGGSILLFILALVIFIASIMFIARYLILIIVLIASSAAIGSWILPSLKKSVYDKWWSALIGQSFFAPVFFLFLYLTIIFMQNTVGNTPSGDGWLGMFYSTAKPGEKSIDLILNYILIVGSLIGTIVVSKSLSNMAGSGAGKITGMLGGAAMGAMAFGGRNTFGRLGKAMNSEEMQEKAKNATGWRRSVLLATSATGAKMKKGSFDPRNAKGAGAILGTAGISAKDGWAANKGGVVSDDKKWKEFKEGVRGTYSEDEIKTKQQEAADRAAEAGKYGIAEARATHTAAKQSKTDLEAEETRIKSEKGKATKTEQERIQKRLEEIQKEKEEADKNIEKTAAAQDKAEKHVRKKAFERFKNSKSDKDKVFEAAMKEIEKNKKAEEGGSDKPKPDKDKDKK